MGKNHADQQTFRERLLRLLMEGRWASHKGETHDELAYRLGVTSEVLDEAMRLRAAENKAKGQPSRQLGTRALHTSEYAVVEVTMPSKVDKHWRLLCATCHVTPEPRGLLELVPQHRAAREAPP
jgi:hypothetical protein